MSRHPSMVNTKSMKLRLGGGFSIRRSGMIARAMTTSTSGSPSDDTTGFLLELDKVHITRMVNFAYLNVAQRPGHFDWIANDLWFTGSFSQTDYTMAVKGDGLVHHLRLEGH